MAWLYIERLVSTSGYLRWLDFRKSEVQYYSIPHVGVSIRRPHIDRYLALGTIAIEFKWTRSVLSAQALGSGKISNFCMVEYHRQAWKEIAPDTERRNQSAHPRPIITGQDRNRHVSSVSQNILTTDDEVSHRCEARELLGFDDLRGILELHQVKWLRAS